MLHQFAPQVGDIDNNLNRADAVLSKANPQNLDLLVLPELAFSGTCTTDHLPWCHLAGYSPVLFAYSFATTRCAIFSSRFHGSFSAHSTL